MSLAFAPLQLSSYHNSYRQKDLSRTSSSLETQFPGTADVHQIARALPYTLSSQHTRWSDSDRCEAKAEDSQMSSYYGSASQPPRDKNRENHTEKLPHPSPENVLPPIVSAPTAIATMHSSGKKSPTLSPNFRTNEATEAGPERRGPRLLGVHSILNPSHGEEDQRIVGRRGVPDMDGERRPPFPTPKIAAASTMSSAPRRILTPISPRIHRATSYGRITGTIDATERPFLSDGSRGPTPEHASGSALLHYPQQTSQVAQHSPFIAPVVPTPPLVHHPSRRTSVSVVGSTRPSPSPSYADSYSQSGISGQTSPAMHPVPGLPPGPTPPGSMQMTPSPNLGPANSVPPGSLDNEQGFHAPVVSSGQNYQILTVDTSKGHMQLAVEVQAASRMADEKRKRNAGASARFRARRKEKEREAASKISNLELELAYAQEDSRHYRAERDYLAEIIGRYAPQYESHLKNRPPSPRLKRGHHIPHRALPTSIDSPISTVDSENYDEEPPTSRRRTESYSYPGTTAAQSQHPQFSPPQYTTYQQGHTQLPAQQQHANPTYPSQNAHVQIAHPPLLARPSATHEAHRPEHAYDSRTWPRSGHGEQHR